MEERAREGEVVNVYGGEVGWIGGEGGHVEAEYSTTCTQLYYY